jgi:hypothetical protein
MKVAKSAAQHTIVANKKMRGISPPNLPPRLGDLAISNIQHSVLLL